MLFVAGDIPWIFLYVYRRVHGETNALGWTVMYPFAVWQAVLFLWVMLLMVFGSVEGVWKLGRGLFRLLTGVHKSAAQPPAADPMRRRILHGGAIGITGIAFVSTTAGVLLRDEFETNNVEMLIPDLPPEFNGFRIAFISDIHSGIFLDKETMMKYAAVVNALKADCIVLPGDFINSMDSEIYPFAEAFSALHAPHGVFGVTGNHDHFANAELVCRESEQAGIKMLRNEHVMLERNGARIALLGIDDPYVGRNEPLRYVQTGKSESIEAMLKGVPDGTKKILLCHRPYPFEEFAQIGMDVMLSGHTHGGQIVLGEFGGLSLSFASLASKYVHGRYVAAGNATGNPRSQMYVSRGIGTVGLPLRINCPPEVTTIVLRT